MLVVDAIQVIVQIRDIMGDPYLPIRRTAAQAPNVESQVLWPSARPKGTESMVNATRMHFNPLQPMVLGEGEFSLAPPCQSVAEKVSSPWIYPDTF